MTLVSFAPFEWFEQWKDEKVTNRSADYKALKQKFIDAALEVVLEVFPKITRDKVKDASCRNVVQLNSFKLESFHKQIF